MSNLRKLTLPPCHLGQCPLSPLLLPLAWGGPRRFALALAGCPLLPATFSALLPCAQVEGRPADGLPRWRLPALHFRRRSRAAPRRRGSRAERQPVLLVFFRVPFLVPDLACLVCTVQIKVVSLFTHFTFRIFLLSALQVAVNQLNAFFSLYYIAASRMSHAKVVPFDQLFICALTA